METRRLGLCNACDANSVATKMKDRHRNECSEAGCTSDASVSRKISDKDDLIPVGKL